MSLYRLLKHLHNYMIVIAVWLVKLCGDFAAQLNAPPSAHISAPLFWGSPAKREVIVLFMFVYARKQKTACNVSLFYFEAANDNCEKNSV